MARRSPELLFVLFSLVGGLLLIAMLPPGMSGNESFNFQRAATVAHGEMLVRPVAVPGGIVRFLESVAALYPEGAKPPYRYSHQQYEAAAAIPLDADAPQVLQPNAIAVLHPVSYLPQVPAIRLGEALGLSPVALIYVGRLAGLLVGVWLTALAIRAMPVHRALLAGIALMPTLLYQRSALDADQFTNPLAFLFLALILREAVGTGPLSRGRIGLLAGLAFLLCQAKSAYLLLPLAALLIPAARFASGRGRLAALALIILPGLLGSLVWMLALKASYFAGIRYVTWSGIVDPDAQLQGIIHDPLNYALVLLRTLFTGPFVAELLMGPIGIIGPSVMIPAPFIALLLLALAAVWKAQPAGLRPNRAATLTWVPLIALATSGLILSLLYLQWTRAGGPVVDGFQGRYLYPLVPLLLVLLPDGRVGGAPRWLHANGGIAAIGTLSIIATSWTAWATFLAPGGPFPFLP